MIGLANILTQVNELTWYLRVINMLNITLVLFQSYHFGYEALTRVRTRRGSTGNALHFQGIATTAWLV